MHTIQSFTRKCRELQSRYRETIGEPMGVGPFRSSKNLQISMIQNGEDSGKNFLTPVAFHYAKQRVANKQKNETIEEYRLFNNLLSSQPMAFNLFCPLIQMIELGRVAEVTSIIQAIFPQIDIKEVTEVGLEFLHTDIENYLGDKTASLREELKEEFRYKVLDITLEYFLEQVLTVCPEEYRKPFLDFRDRYLNFEM